MGYDFGGLDLSYWLGLGDGSGDGSATPSDQGGDQSGGSLSDVGAYGPISIGDPGIGTPITDSGIPYDQSSGETTANTDAGTGAPTVDTSTVIPDPGQLSWAGDTGGYISDQGAAVDTSTQVPDAGSGIQIPTDLQGQGMTGGQLDQQGQIGTGLEQQAPAQDVTIATPISIPVQLPPIDIPFSPPQVPPIEFPSTPITEPPSPPVETPATSQPSQTTTTEPGCAVTVAADGSITVNRPDVVQQLIKQQVVTTGAPGLGTIINVVNVDQPTAPVGPTQFQLVGGPLEVSLPGLERVQSQLVDAITTIGQQAYDIGDRIASELDQQIQQLIPAQLDLAAQANTILGGLVDEFQNAFPAYDSIAQGFADQLTSNWTTIAPQLDQLISTSIGDGIINALQGMTAGGAPNVLKLFDAMPGGACVSALVKGYLAPLAAEGLLTDGLALIMGMVDTLRVFIDASLVGPTRLVEQDSLLCARPELLGVSDVQEAQRRGLIDDATAVDQLGRHGFKDQLITALQALARRLLEREDVIQLSLRGLISDDERDARLTQLGYQGQDIDDVARLAQLLPTPTDVVSWMLRDLFPAPIATATYDADGNATFTESSEPIDFVSAFGMDLEFPKGALPLFAQLGLSEKYAHQYWQAHWELPSPQAAAEMFQRGFISEQAYRRLLRARGVEPYWRTPYEQIIYHPITRVDIRRIHKLLGKDHAWLVTSYRNIGYSPADAEQLAQFTEALNSQETAADKLNERTTLKGQIETLYVDGYLDEQQATQQLTALGYPADHVQAYIAGAAVKRQYNLDEQVAKAVKQLYVTLHWDKQTAADALAHEGFTADAINRMFESWDIDRQYRELTQQEKEHRELTKAEVLEAFGDRIINTETASQMLAKLFYTPDQIALMLELENVKAAKADQAAVVDAVHAQYLTGTLTRSDAVAQLDGAGVSHTKREGLLAKWTLELQKRSARLTVAQIEQLYVGGLISDAVATDELQREGYGAQDTQLLLALFGSAEAQAKAKEAKAAQTAAATAARQAAALARQTAHGLTAAQLEQTFKAGITDEAQTRGQLAELGYRPAQIDELITLWGG